MVCIKKQMCFRALEKSALFCLTNGFCVCIIVSDNNGEGSAAYGQYRVSIISDTNQYLHTTCTVISKSVFLHLVGLCVCTFSGGAFL